MCAEAEYIFYGFSLAQFLNTLAYAQNYTKLLQVTIFKKYFLNIK